MSRRSATLRTCSSRLAVSPISASTGATSASARSRSLAEPVSVAASTSPTWNAGSSTASLTSWLNRSAEPPASMSAGSSPAGVAHREHDARPKAVIHSALPVALRQAHRAQLVDREAGPLSPRQHLVPGTRRKADVEVAQHLLPQPALGQILPRLRRLLGLP